MPDIRQNTIKVIHDAVGQTLTVWRDDPRKEHICTETPEEAVFMKDAGLAVETVIHTNT